MSSSASASLVFGIDLGDSNGNGWNFEDDELSAPWDDDGRSIDFDDLIAEFGGFTEIEVDFEKDESAWVQQRSRYQIARGSTGLDVDHYGYEFSGTLITVGATQTVHYGYAPLTLDLEDHDQLYDYRDQLYKFIKFLDSKGLKLKEEFRKPKWLLVACYG